MNLDVALYHAVHDFDPGTNRLAELMNIAPSTLQNMANPRNTDQPWTVKAIRQVMELTKDRRVIDAWCAECGGIFMPIATGPAGDSMDLFRRLGVATKNLGELAAEVEKATADGSISINDRDRIHQECYEVHQAVMSLDRQVDKLAGPAKGPLAVVK
jgi:hypothetical protein